MTDILPIVIAIAGAAASWLCYRWGYNDGRFDGYEDGVADAEMQSGSVSPSAVGGPGAVPR